MYPRLFKFLDKYDRLYQKQCGFGNSQSTKDAFFTITEKIRETLVKLKISIFVEYFWTSKKPLIRLTTGYCLIK